MPVFLTETIHYGSETLSVIGVGVRLAVCLKGAKVEKSLFGGLRNQHAPKT